MIEVGCHQKHLILHIATFNLRKVIEILLSLLEEQSTLEHHQIKSSSFFDKLGVLLSLEKNESRHALDHHKSGKNKDHETIRWPPMSKVGYKTQ